MAIPKHKLYNVAETLFVEQGMTCAAISESIGVREATLSTWRTTQKWDERRRVALSSPTTIKQILLTELEAVSKGNKPKVDTDALSKIAKTLQYFDQRVAVSVVAAVFREFDQFVTDDDPKLAIKFAEYHRRFLNYRAQQEA